MTLLSLGDVAADTRPASTLITGDLATVWPEVSHRLAKLLTSRGASPDVVDDVVQEVAARVLSYGVSFDSAMDLMRWAVPVALNLLVDNARAVQRVTPVDTDDYDQPCADVADLVAHRDRVRRVLGAIPLLSPADRAALASPQETPADRKEAVRLAVRRHRARRRLLALVDGVAAFAAFVGALLKRTRMSTASASVAVAALPVALLLVAPGSAPDGSGTPERAVEAVRPARVVRPAQPAPARERPAQRPAVRRPGGTSRPAPARPAVRPAGPAAKTVVDVDHAGVKVEQHDPRKGDGLVCVRDARPLPDVCLFPGPVKIHQ